MVSNVFNQLNSIIDNGHPILNRYLPEKSEEVVHKARAKLNEKQVKIQLYGAYNAGKSSLINLLLGEKCAAEGDKPVTDRVDSYEWNGICLLDTPGVNAPIAHEEVTMEALKSSDLIILVIRVGDHDTKDIYERLLELIQNKKQVFILLNYEGLDPNSTGEDGTAFMVNYIRQNIQKYAGDNSPDLAEQLKSYLNIIPLNVVTAYKGKTEQKNLLLDKSGYLDFERQFNDWLEKFNNETQLVEGIKNYLESQYLEPIVNELQSFLSSDSELQEKQSALSQAQRKQENMIQSMSINVKNIAINHQPTLREGLQNIASEVEVKQVIESFLLDCSKEFQAWLEGEINEQVMLEMLQSSNTDYSKSENGQSNQFFEQTLDMGVNFIKNNPEMVNEGIRNALQYAKKIAPDLMKGRGPVWMGKAAGKAAPFVNLALIGYDMYSANKEQETQNSAVKNQVYQLETLIDDISSQFVSNTREQGRAIINEVFKPLLESLETEVNGLKQNTNETERDFNQIQGLMSELHIISV